jgi:hypothetical protein
MMRKTASIIAISALLVSLVAGVQVEVAKANPMIGTKPTYAKISIESPQNNSELNAENYNVTGIQLSFTVKTNHFVQSGYNYSDSHCFIVLDSKSNEFKDLHLVGQTTISNDSDYNPYTELTLTGNTSLSNLEKGAHKVEVKYGFYYAWPNNSYIIDYIVLFSASVGFTLNGEINSESASTSPADSTDPIHFIDAGLTIYSPVNMTYHYTDLFLNISLGSAGLMGGLDPNISMNYSIDNAYNGSVPLESTREIHVVSRAVALIVLPDVPNGSHNLTIYLYGLNQRAVDPKYLSFTLSVYFSTTGKPNLNPTISPTTTSSPTPSPTPTLSPGMSPSPSVPEFPSWIILPLVLTATLLTVLFIKRKKNPN